MVRFEVKRSIGAPAEVVFKVVSDVREKAEAVPHVASYEFLEGKEPAVGLRFRETRELKGKRQETELEITEYVEGERVRMVAEQGGALWDTTFTVASGQDGATALVMTMDATLKSFAAKLFIPLFKRTIQKAVEKDMDCVKTYCERGGS